MTNPNVLETFIRLSHAEDEQSFSKDVLELFSNPIWLVVSVGTIMFLTRVFPTTSDKNHQQQLTPSWTVIWGLAAWFGVLHSLDFNVGLTAPYSMGLANKSTTTTTNSLPPGSMYKTYTTYSQFYQEAYQFSHVLLWSRVSHVLLASSVVATWVVLPTLFVPSVTALLVGATFHPVLRSTDIPFVELTLVFVVGLGVSHLAYQNMVQWFLFFQLWMLVDYLDHHWLGHNGSVAVFIGQHYLSWALLGQLQLATTIMFHVVQDAVSTFT